MGLLLLLTFLLGVETTDESCSIVFLLQALPLDHLLLIDDDDKEEEDLFVIHSPLVGIGFFEVVVLEEKAKRLESFFLPPLDTESLDTESLFCEQWPDKSTICVGTSVSSFIFMTTKSSYVRLPIISGPMILSVCCLFLFLFFLEEVVNPGA